MAHPIEMDAETLQAWQKYFIANKISQPFEQIWEPVYKAADIDKDRYSGCAIYWRRFQNADKHGIHSFDLDDFRLEGCNLEYELDGEWTVHERVILGAFSIERFSRKVNHIIYMLDKWTIEDRIRKDDGKVMEIIGNYNISQINKLMDLAIESKATQLTVALITYKAEHFAESDAFGEFVLEW